MYRPLVAPGQPAHFILDEDDVAEDPFPERMRAKLAPGEIPTLTYVQQGMSVTTIEVPAMGEAKLWHNFLHQLQCASGVVVLRGVGQTMWDKDIYVLMQEIWAEVAQVVDSREMFIINVAKGDVRSLMMALPAFAQVSLATPDSTFGFPEVRLGGLPSVAACMLRKRLSDEAIRTLITNGEPIDAFEAQRLGLVDFVGDVETELARLIFRNCQPQVTNIMYRPDCEKAWKQQEEMAK